jgi:hypothetical protein
LTECFLELHRQLRGKIKVVALCPITSKDERSLAYTPGVARSGVEIEKVLSLCFELTRHSSTVAVITDGTAVLGVGDIGPKAGMPVMEGKCVLFKAFGGIDALPLCLRTKDVDEIIQPFIFYPIHSAASTSKTSPGLAASKLSFAFPNAFRIVGKSINNVSVITSATWHEDRDY